MIDRSLKPFEIGLSTSSLESYVAYANKIPLLTQHEEFDFATRLQKQGDINAAKPLILAHLRYVIRVARDYQGYGLALNDLIQEGNIGLMKAVKRFNPEVGVRLVTFAVHWIKAEIHEFILRNWRIVKIATTKAQRKLFFNLRNMKKRLGWFTQEEINAVANDLGVKPETVREMEMRLNASDTPFDPPNDSDEENISFSPAGYLEDHRFSPTVQHEKTDTTTQSNAALHQALTQLDERSQDILHTRWLSDDKSTLQELANKYRISPERIRQLEKSAMQKLKIALEDLTA